MDSNSTNTTLGNVIACEEPSEAAYHVYQTFSWLFENIIFSNKKQIFQAN